MMMEQAKPENNTTTATEPSPEPTAPSVTKTNASAEERVQDLERRLNLLGNEGSAGGASVASGSTASSSSPAAANPTTAPSQPAKNNPLLARIMAAQERARQAEQKEKEAKLASDRAVQAEKDAALKKAEEERIQKARSVLKSAAGNALEDKQERILRELEGKKPADAPRVGELKAPPKNSFQPAPPPFEAINFQASEQHQEQQNTQQHFPMSSLPHQQQLHQQHNQPQPPSFDFVEQQLKPPPSPAPAAPSAPSPSAPEIMHHEYDHFEGILPVAPPPTEQQPPSHDFLSDSLPAPPPSFTEFEQQQQEQFNPDMDDGIFAYDDEGNPLSPKQRQAMIDEQRRLYEEIVKEKAANDAAIAQANADAFDSRSSSAAVKAMESQNQIMDSVGRVDVNGETSAAEDDEEGARERRSRRMVKIGNNQTVALHGQERTKKAIKEGTAILVQCINCQNWMQVTETATLMFCPVCQVVSPVIKQNEVMTKDEAIQLTMDRKLAEKLQAEAYASEEEEDGGKGGGKAEEGYFAKLFGMGGTEEASSTSSPATASKTADDSWWGKISSIVSYGVAEEPKERGDLGVTRPPGSSSSSSYPGQRRGVRTMNHTSISSAGSSSPSRSEEYAGLLRPVTDGNEANLPAGRVAEQKPLFSCIYDSVSTAASAAFSTGAGEDGEGNVHGVDSSSLLVTNARRGDGGGNYSQLPDDE
mmetsp:Transcript_17528/g.36789  ORF Transcript_17528/g.36789 Transcript_17528/m.36789 type:complete len:702 (+) Transcript_17528:133-2238(+)|eukprot:CAMPEP_0171350710 /NCGR_PEP_ID=MMETSP0878-20121228/37054_1 /TAXON_ID=67004 /ORGANISM="Thalassiosira weissflogii, Strain CCMP1336" /LENGTH=701 /DNA_ID=CAMNT_0011855707 /DNA_START=103 /DNA_END=2208 /DNA_ORIENTATION=+